MNATVAATFPVGNVVERSVYRPLADVIAEPEQGGTGNTVLRIGREIEAEASWEQTGHVVLTPAERDLLIDALIAQRDNA